MTKPGKYSRVESFIEAVQSILNPEAIFVTIDLHLHIGSQMVNDVRKVSELIGYSLPCILERYWPLAYVP